MKFLKPSSLTFILSTLYGASISATAMNVAAVSTATTIDSVNQQALNQQPFEPLAINNPTIGNGQQLTTIHFRKDNVGFGVSSGLPFAIGQVFNVNQLALKTNEQQQIPAQFNVLAKWPDGSIKSALTSVAPQNIPSNKTASLWLMESAVISQTTSPIIISQNDHSLSLSNGVVEIKLKTTGGELFDHIAVDSNHNGEFSADESIASQGEIYFINAKNEQEYSSSLGNFTGAEIVYAGEHRTSIKLTGDFSNTDNDTLLKYEASLTVYAGQAGFDFDLTVLDDRPEMNVQLKRDELALAISEYGVRFKHQMSGGNYHFGGESANLDFLPELQDYAEKSYTKLKFAAFQQAEYNEEFSGKITDKHHLLQTGEFYYIDGKPRNPDSPDNDTYDFAFSGVGDGDKAEGWMSIDNNKQQFSVFVKDFWQQFPNELEVTTDSFTIKLHPSRHIAGNEVTIPQETDGSYGGTRYVRPNTFYFKREGGAKTYQMRFAVNPQVSNNEQLQHLNDIYQIHDLDFTTDNQWYADSKVFGDINISDSTSAAYDKYLLNNIYLYSLSRSALVRPYGWRDFGDRLRAGFDMGKSGMKVPSYFNDSHVGGNSFIHQYLRTNNKAWFHVGETATRHFSDIDVSHAPRKGYHADGQDVDGDGDYEYVFQLAPAGEPHLIKHDNIDHEVRNIHTGHAHVSGLSDLYLLTGDIRYKTVFDEIANWWAFINESKYPVPRPLTSKPDADDSRAYSEAERDFAWPLYSMNEYVRTTSDFNYHKDTAAHFVTYLTQWWQTPTDHIRGDKVLGVNDASQGTGWWAMDHMDNSPRATYGHSNGTNPWMAGPLLSALIAFYQQDLQFREQGLDSGIDHAQLKDMMWQTMNYVVKNGWNETREHKSYDYFVYSEVQRKSGGVHKHLVYPLTYLYLLLQEDITQGKVANPQWYDTAEKWNEIASKAYSEMVKGIKSSGSVSTIIGQGSQNYGFYGYEMVFPADWLNIAKNLPAVDLSDTDTGGSNSGGDNSPDDNGSGGDTGNEEPKVPVIPASPSVEGAAGDHTAIMKNSLGNQWGFYEYLPETFDENSKDLGILVYFNGGNSGKGSTQEMNKMLNQGLPLEIENGLTSEFIVVSYYVDSWDAIKNDISLVDKAIDFVKQKYVNHIDPNKLILSGFSRGGQVAMRYTDAYPEKVAALVTVASVFVPSSTDFDEGVSEVATWLFHHEEDSIVWEGRSGRIHKRIIKQSTQLTDSQREQLHKLTIYTNKPVAEYQSSYHYQDLLEFGLFEGGMRDQYHNTTDLAFNTPELWTWLAKQSTENTYANETGGETSDGETGGDETGSGESGGDETGSGETGSGETGSGEASSETSIVLQKLEQLSFDGQTFTEIAHHDDLLLNDGSIAFWFKANSIGKQQGLLSKDSSGYDTGGHLTLLLEKDGRINYRLQSTTSTTQLRSQNAVSADEWHHLALTFGANGMQLYLDGVLDNHHSNTAGLGNSSGGMGNFEPLVLGANAWGSGNKVSTPVIEHFTGELGELFIFNQQISVETAQSLFLGILPKQDSEAHKVTQSQLVFEQTETVNFTGNHFQEVAHQDDFLLDNGSISLWVNLEETNRRQGLLSKDSNQYDTGGHITLLAESGGQLRYRLQTASSNHELYSNARLTKNTWHHITLTFGDDGMKLYIDGSLDKADSSRTHGLGVSSGGSGNFEPIVLGANAWGSDDKQATPAIEYLAGQLDNIFIFDEALSADNIALIHDLAAPGVDVHYSSIQSSIADTNRSDDEQSDNEDDTGDSDENSDTPAVVFTPIFEQNSFSHFDGSNFEQIPHQDEFLLNNGSIAFSFKAEQLGSQKGLLSKDSGGYDTGGHLTVLLESSGKIRYRLQNINATKELYSNAKITDNEWHHVVLSFGEQGMQLFIDGELDNQLNFASGLGGNSGGSGNFEPIVIGANAWASGDKVATPLQNQFVGEIANLAVFAEQLNLATAVELTK
jgi:predicted esterase